jgi:hypothetical protein
MANGRCGLMEGRGGTVRRRIVRWYGAAAEITEARRLEKTQRRTGDRGGTAEQRARAQIVGGGDRLKRKTEKGDRNERLKERRSAFHAVTGRADRLTEHGGVASGQSLVSSWRDQMCPVSADRTRTESGQRSPGNSSRLTGRGGGVWDRTQWSQHRVRSSVRSQILEICL